MILKVVDKTKNVRFMVECSYFVWRRASDSGTPRWILEIHAMITRTHKRLNTSDTKIEQEASVHVNIYDGDTVFVMNADGKVIETTGVLIGKDSRHAERMRQLVQRGYTEPEPRRHER